MEDGYQIVPLLPDHLPGVAELEKLCFSEPWSQKSLSMLTAAPGTGFAVISPLGEVLGYGGMLCVLDEGQITNIAVHPDARRCGIGKAILSALMEYAAQTNLREITLEVRSSNEGAHRLYRSAGFEVCGVRKKFYRMPTEDALLMRYEIADR